MSKIGILFIHGLGGSENTWGDFKTFLETDADLYDKIQIEFYEYRTSLLPSLGAAKLGIEDLSDVIRTELETKFSECDDVILIGHSLGGLIGKHYLIQEVKERRKLKVSTILNFATPHTGAQIAELLIKFTGFQWQIKELAGDAQVIKNIEEDWLSLQMGLNVYAANVIGKRDKVVDSASSQALAEELFYVDEDHRSIVKPASPVSNSYLIVKETILRHENQLRKSNARTAGYAQDIIDRKSSAMSTSRTKPETIERKLYKHQQNVRPNRADSDLLRLTLDVSHPMELDDAFSQSNLNFLFGEIGSGKSTLLAKYSIKSCSTDSPHLVIFITADKFIDAKLESFDDLYSQIDSHLKSISESGEKSISFSEIILRNIETVIIIDGFDELSISQASLLLSICAGLVEKCSNVKIIASGRPIELEGLRYLEWNLFEIEPLTDTDIKQLFVNFALADGVELTKAEMDALRKLNLIKERSDISSMATTPLMVKMLWQYYDESQRDVTIGSLLYQLLLSRIGNWDAQEGKTEPLRLFSEAYPTPISREPIIAHIANQYYKGKLKVLSYPALYDSITNIVNANEKANQLIEEIIIYLQRNILLNESGNYAFSSYPLLQCAQGLYYYYALKQGQTPIDVDDLQWREYSFACAIARVKENKTILLGTTKQIINQHTERGYIGSNMSLILVESDDIDVARYAISENPNKLRMRPFSFYDGADDWAIPFARILMLLGEDGILWFYNRYLDPRYPLFIWQSRVADEVFGAWAQLSNFKLSHNIQVKILEAINYHIKIPSSYSDEFLRISSLLLPSAFESSHRVRLHISALEQKYLKTQAEQQLLLENDRNPKALQHQINLFLRENTSARTIIAQFGSALVGEPLNVVLIANLICQRKRQDFDAILDQIKNAVGELSLKRILTWLCISDHNSSTYAALALYSLGETNLSILGNALLKGLHDGGKIEEAEEVLSELVIIDIEKSILWLFNVMSSRAYEYSHSTHWRIILKLFIQSKEDHAKRLIPLLVRINEHIIPRYADVRNLFLQLLSKRPEYLTVLKSALISIDSIKRFNSSCILVCTDPRNNLESLYYIISVAKQRQRDEIYRFILKLDFDKSELLSLKARIDHLNESCQAFFSLLLYHSKHYLDNREYERLVLQLLTKDSRLDHSANLQDDEIPMVLGQERTYPLLLSYLSDSKLKVLAARQLLYKFADRLSLENLLVCMLMNTEDTFRQYDIHFLERVTIEINNEIKNGNNPLLVPAIAEQLVIKPYLSELLFPQYDRNLWKEIINSIFLSDGFHGSEDTTFNYLLYRIHNDKKLKHLVGELVAELLKDDRWTNPQFAGRREEQWLAFFGNECGSISKSDLVQYVEDYHDHDYMLRRAIALRCDYTKEKPKNDPPSKKTDDIILEDHEKIVDMLRVNLGVHPRTNEIIETLLISEEQKLANEQMIVDSGMIGEAVICIVRFCYSQYDYSLLIKSAADFHDRHLKNENATSASIALALKIIREVIAFDNITNEEYLIAAKRCVLAEQGSFTLFAQLVDGGFLDEDIIESYCKFICDNEYVMPDWFAFYFCRYILTCPLAFQNILFKEILKGSEFIANDPDTTVSYTKCFSYWTYALARTYSLGKPDDICAYLFLDALRFGFLSYGNKIVNNLPQMPMAKLLNATYELFEKISEEHLNYFFEYGDKSEENEIRGLCRFFRLLPYPTKSI